MAALSESIFGTNAIENDTAIRIEALRLSLEAETPNEQGHELRTQKRIERANLFYKFIKDGTVPVPDDETKTA